MAAAAGWVEAFHLVELEGWTWVLWRVDEERQLVEKRASGIVLDQPTPQRVLHEEVDDVPRGEELVADGKFA